MRTEFLRNSRGSKSVLRSPVVTVATAQCLYISYFASSDDLIVEIASLSVPTNDSGAVETVLANVQLSAGQSQIIVNITAGEFQLEIRAYASDSGQPTSSTGNDDDDSVVYVMIYEIQVTNGPCCNEKSKTRSNSLVDSIADANRLQFSIVENIIRNSRKH